MDSYKDKTVVDFSQARRSDPCCHESRETSWFKPWRTTSSTDGEVRVQDSVSPREKFFFAGVRQCVMLPVVDVQVCGSNDRVEVRGRSVCSGPLRYVATFCIHLTFTYTDRRNAMATGFISSTTALALAVLNASQSHMMAG